MVILYKGIPADQVDQLRQFVEARTGPSSSWPLVGPGEQRGRPDRLAEPRDQRVNMDVVQAFVNDYMVPATKSTAPEPNAA